MRSRAKSNVAKPNSVVTDSFRCKKKTSVLRVSFFCGVLSHFFNCSGALQTISRLDSLAARVTSNRREAELHHYHTPVGLQPGDRRKKSQRTRSDIAQPGAFCDEYEEGVDFRPRPLRRRSKARSGKARSLRYFHNTIPAIHPAISNGMLKWMKVGIVES